eukprot:TRINITY_DN11182_c0_g2_i1.p2 TRINITY_DN11182_c0_g2~~TRINITY_DN11182_c0_g2_i1.p2  ORF type:complete len:153 (-),score=30.99 TRINITY_DN11182_c0_g2_i1:137-538(-)
MSVGFFVLVDLFFDVWQLFFFFFSSRRRHTRCREVSWARRCVQETGVHGEIDWNEMSINHIARHNVEAYGVEQVLYDNDLRIDRTDRDRQILIGKTFSGRILFVVVSYPPEASQIRVITARDVTKTELRRYRR